MWMTPHTLVGITIVSRIENPMISLPMAFLSHYVMDFIPHWTQSPSFKGKEGLFLYLDFVIGLTCGIFFACQNPIFSDQFWLIIIGAALANLPDAIQIPRLIKYGNLKENFKKKNWYFVMNKFHHLVDQDLSPKNGTIFKKLKGKTWLGILTQVMVVSICLFLLFSK